jgi:hypothetical protein
MDAQSMRKAIEALRDQVADGALAHADECDVWALLLALEDLHEQVLVTRQAGLPHSVKNQ